MRTRLCDLLHRCMLLFGIFLMPQQRIFAPAATAARAHIFAIKHTHAYTYTWWRAICAAACAQRVCVRVI